MRNEKMGSWSVPLAMPVEAAMRTQRAIRRFKPDPVDDDLLLHLIELATKAPAGGGRQYAEFIIVRDRTVKAQLARLNRVAWSSYGLGGHPKPANDGQLKTGQRKSMRQDVDAGGGGMPRRRDGKRLERAETTASDRVGAAGMAAAAH